MTEVKFAEIGYFVWWEKVGIKLWWKISISSIFNAGNLQALQAPGLDVEVRNGTSEVLHEVVSGKGNCSAPKMGFHMV